MTLVLVLASNNPDKAAEIRAVLGAALPGLELRPRPPEVGEVEETGATLEDNARLKAVAIADAVGLPAVADDTGLEVAALGGAPGVYSSRYAGEHATYADNVAKLLKDRNLKLEVTPAAKDLIIGEGYDPQFGARPMKRAIQRLVQDPLALKLLNGDFADGDTVLADVAPQPGQLQFTKLVPVSV